MTRDEQQGATPAQQPSEPLCPCDFPHPAHDLCNGKPYTVRFVEYAHALRAYATQAGEENKALRERCEGLEKERLAARNAAFSVGFNGGDLSAIITELAMRIMRKAEHAAEWQVRAQAAEERAERNERDAKRLDFFQANPKSVSRAYGYLGAPDCWSHWADTKGIETGKSLDLREAIDAALASQDNS